MAGRAEAVLVCAYVPRFELVVAAGGHQALAGRALALAPSGARAVVGELSGAAEAAGLTRGMAVAEALARCPALTLVPADPLGVARAWEAVLCALEGIGAAVETPGPGLLYFDARGLRGLYGGLEGVIAATRRALGGRPARIGAGPTRFCALAAASGARARRTRVIGAREARPYLASQPVTLLSCRAETAVLVEPLQRLGIATLGAMLALGAGAVSDRFGVPGLHARALALCQEEPLRPRRPEDRLEESLSMCGSSSMQALERALDLLLERLLARPERRGRTIRAMRISARLAERGTWSERVTFRQALCERRAMRLALGLRLAGMPAPAETLTLEVDSFGPPLARQQSLLDGERALRAGRLREAVRQLRALAGPEAALRLAPVEPDSRIPERRFAFTPFTP